MLAWLRRARNALVGSGAGWDHCRAEVPPAAGCAILLLVVRWGTSAGLIVVRLAGLIVAGLAGLGLGLGLHLGGGVSSLCVILLWGVWSPDLQAASRIGSCTFRCP